VIPPVVLPLFRFSPTHTHVSTDTHPPPKKCPPAAAPPTPVISHASPASTRSSGATARAVRCERKSEFSTAARAGKEKKDSPPFPPLPLSASAIGSETKKNGSGGKFTWGSWTDEAGEYMRKGLEK